MESINPAPGAALALLRISEVLARTGLSRSEVYRKVQLGLFPAPVKLGERASAWAAHEIDRWITERLAARERAA